MSDLRVIIMDEAGVICDATIEQTSRKPIAMAVEDDEERLRAAFICNGAVGGYIGGVLGAIVEARKRLAASLNAGAQRTECPT